MRARKPRRPGPGARSEPHVWRTRWLAILTLAIATGSAPALAHATGPTGTPQLAPGTQDLGDRAPLAGDAGTPAGAAPPPGPAPVETNAAAPSVRSRHPAAAPGASPNRSGGGTAPLAPRPSTPAWDVEQAAQCAAAIHDAETRHALPPGLLGAIAKTESGRPVASLGDVRAWPWTIDADGQGLFFESKAAAVAWARQGLARGVRFMDIGCMQVNLQMHPEAFPSIEDAFDPASNAEYAARYLRQLQAEAGGNWNVAVGLYHSHTPDLAAAYRERVAQVGAGIVTGIGGPEPLYMRAIRQGTLHLALAGGGMLVINLNRQPHAPRRRGQSPCQVASMLRPLLASPPRVKGCRT
jgi:hypothetical protein